MKYLILVCAAFLCGCSATLNGSGDLPASQTSIFWTNESIFNSYIIRNINGNEMKMFPSKLTDVPGHKEMLVELSGNFQKDGSGPYAYVRFKFSIEAKAGQSYNFKLFGGARQKVNDDAKLCIMEEPHDAPGSSVNMTNEYRHPSESAKIIQCTSAVFVMQ